MLNLLAEADLDAQPETTEDPDGEEKRAHGRGFVGPDAEAAEAILASVRENHVAQAAGRYARDADDPENTATVFVRTDALPAGFADLKVPGVEWVLTDTQRSIVKELRNRQGATARELAEATGASKKHVAETLNRLAEKGRVTAREGEGDYGATVYRDDETPSSGVAELDMYEIRNDSVWGSYTWSFAIYSPDALDSGSSSGNPPADYADGPPPEGLSGLWTTLDTG